MTERGTHRNTFPLETGDPDAWGDDPLEIDPDLVHGRGRRCRSHAAEVGTVARHTD